MGSARVLFCTAAGEGYGMGHLRRCLAVAHEGKDSFRSTLCLLRGERQALERVELPPELESSAYPEGAGHVDLVVSDLRDTNRSEMRRLVRIAPVFAIDDAGEGSRLAAVCVYPLPLIEDLPGNYTGQSYMVLPSRIRKLSPLVSEKKQGVLVSFGGSDPEGLTPIVAGMLNRMGIRPIVVRGPLFSSDLSGIDAEIVDGGADILDLINGAEVLISSFGITAYEAFYLGTPVVLFNRSRYHEELAQRSFALSLGFKGGIDLDDLEVELKVTLEDKKKLRERALLNRSVVDGNGASRIVSIINEAVKGKRKDCLFSHKRYRAVKRCEEYSIFRCSRCGDLFLYELRDKGEIYDKKDYFLDDYERQYGKSYIEDRENIVLLGLDRIKTIEKIAGGRGRILDVGCALGFFLDLARSRGWEVQGIEISDFAGRWAKKNLSLDVFTGSFLDMDLEPESYDAVSFLFVAEHLGDMDSVARKTYAILKKGGIICIALPNRGGISYRINRKEYIDRHPRDHYIDTTVRNLRRFLRGYGFKQKRVRITGIHPERFFRAVGKSCSDRIYRGAAKIFSLGDTFEFYAVKE
jgi:spore coat polysaccharide biosynthesis predicted glycosyltransferase SpsG/SAM-dependent methyltransferase